MGELIEGLLEFGSEANGFISKVEEITVSLKNMAEVFDTFFNTGVMEKAFENVQDKIKSIGPMLAAAAKQGRLNELLGDAFEAAVERLGSLLFNPNFWMGLAYMLEGAFGMAGAGLMKIVLNTGIALKTVLDKAFQDIYQEMGKIPGVGKALGLSDYKAESFSQIYEENRQANAPANQYLNKLTGIGEEFFTEGRNYFSEAIDESKTGPAQDKLKSLERPLSPPPAKTPAHVPAPSSNEAKSHDSHPHHHHHPKAKESDARNHFKPEFTSLEKMGFIMSGNKVQNPYDQRKIDLLQQIARNTSVQTVGRGWGTQDPNHTIRDAILETNAL